MPENSAIAQLTRPYRSTFASSRPLFGSSLTKPLFAHYLTFCRFAICTLRVLSELSESEVCSPVDKMRSGAADGSPREKLLVSRGVIFVDLSNKRQHFLVIF